jgi:flavin-dependent dehydrogenase
VLAGDAAGFFDGVSGEGMSLALRTAPWCAAAIAAYLHTGDERAFATYDRRRRSAAHNSELLARVTLALAHDRRIAAFAIRNMRRRPATFDRLVAISGGELPLHSLRPRDVPALLFGI